MHGDPSNRGRSWENAAGREALVRGGGRNELVIDAR